MRVVPRWFVDCAVVAAAVWTLAYHLGLALELPVLPLLAGWFAVLVPCAVGLAATHRRTHPPNPPGTAGVGSPSAWRVAVIVVAALLAAVSAAAQVWPALVAFGAGAVVACVPSVRSQRRAGRTVDVPQWHEAVAVAVAAVLGVLSVFVVRPDADDVFYVNRSVWVAEHDRLPVGDVLFGDGGTVLPGMAPVSAIEALAGGLARLLHAPAASVVWYLLPPVVTILAVLALWQLIKAWAPRRPLACLLLALVFLLWSGGSAASFGSFHLVRAWQGKAILVSLVVPALWTYLTEWARDRSRTALLLAVAAGVAGIGFSSSAAFVIPLIAVAAGIGLTLLGRYRDLPALALVTLYPLLGGLMVSVLFGPPSRATGGETLPPSQVWLWVIGAGVAGLMGAVSVWWAPLLVRGPVPAAYAWGGAALAVFLLLPGVLNLAGLLSGSAPVLWRTLWMLPAPALVGLLAAAPVGPLLRAARRPTAWARHPVLARHAAWLPSAALGLLLVVTAVPVWSHSNRAALVSRPQWKADLASGRHATAVLRAYPGARLVLAPPGVMRAITARTATVKVVDPRRLYTIGLTDGTADQRRLLSDFAARRTVPPPDRLEGALVAIRVDVACVRRDAATGIAALRAAGLAGDRQVSSLVCLTPRDASPSLPGPPRPVARPERTTTPPPRRPE